MKYATMLIMLLIVPLALASTEYTESTSKTCDGNKCTLILHSKPQYTYEGGRWHNFTDVTDLYWTGKSFNFTYNDAYWLALEPYAEYNGVDYTIQQIKDLYPGVSMSGGFNTYKRMHKFAPTISNIPPGLNNTGLKFGFRLEAYGGFGPGDVVKEDRSIIIKNKVRVSFDDLIGEGFSIDRINKTHVVIGNITGQMRGGMVVLDPTLELSTSTENLFDGYADNSLPNADASGNLFMRMQNNTAGTYRYPIMVWNITALQQLSGVVISDATVNFNTKTDYLESGDDLRLVAYRVYNNYTWGGSYVRSWNNLPNSSENFESHLPSAATIISGADVAVNYKNYVNITDILQRAYNQGLYNTTFFIKVGNQAGNTDVPDWWEVYSIDDPGTYDPQINITYESSAPAVWGWNETYTNPDTIVNKAVTFDYAFLQKPYPANDTYMLSDNVNATFSFNGQPTYTSSTGHLGDNVTGNFTYSTSVTPTILGVNNFTWFIKGELNNGSIVNRTLSASITVYDLYAARCDGLGSNVTLNISFYREPAPTDTLSSTLEIDFVYWAVTGYNYTLNAEYTNNISYYLCIQPANTDYYADAYLKYTYVDGFTHRYYLVNQSLNDSVTYIRAYNFNFTTGVSDLRITARKPNYDYFKGLYVSLQRYYPDEGVWRTVQMDKTGDFGLGFFNIVEENTDYRLIFMDQNRVILKETARSKFVCTDAICEVTVIVSETATTTVIKDISSNSTFDNVTKTLYVDWSDRLNTANTVTLEVFRPESARSITVCSTTTSAESGTFTCDLSAYNKGQAILKISADDTTKVTEYIDIGQQKLNQVLTRVDGGFYTFAIGLIAAGAGAAISPVAAIIGVIVGLVISFFLGIFTPLTAGILILLGLVGVVLGVKMQR